MYKNNLIWLAGTPTMGKSHETKDGYGLAGTPTMGKVWLARTPTKGKKQKMNMVCEDADNGQKYYRVSNAMLTASALQPRTRGVIF